MDKYTYHKYLCVYSLYILYTYIHIYIYFFYLLRTKQDKEAFGVT